MASAFHHDFDTGNFADFRVGEMLTLSLSVVATDASIVFEVDPFIAAYANALGVEPVTYCAQYHRPDGSMMDRACFNRRL